MRVRTIKPFPLQSISLQPAIQARLQINGEVQLRSPCVPGCKEKIGVKTPHGPQIDSIPELTAQAGRPAGSCYCRGERGGRAKFLPPCANALRPAVSWLRVTVYFPNNLKRGVCILFPCVGPRPPRREVEVRCRFISAPAHVENEAFHHTHTYTHTLVLSPPPQGSSDWPLQNQLATSQFTHTHTKSGGVLLSATGPGGP